MSSCTRHGRHWFAYYGIPGSSSPVCVRRCGAPNPRYDVDADPHADDDPLASVARQCDDQNVNDPCLSQPPRLTT